MTEIKIPPYAMFQPLRKVVRRTLLKKGEDWYDENLECGHVKKKQRPQNGSTFARRRCFDCPPLPPLLEGVEVVESDEVPLVPGWYFATPSGRPAIKRTKVVYINPEYRAAMPVVAKATYNACPCVSPCPKCGMTFKSYGGRASHMRSKHK